MGFNLNSGYGQTTQSVPFLGGGQAFVVAKSAAAGREILQQIFKSDQLGTLRYFATVQGAVDQCVASRGDVIFVMPGHSETITTDGGLALSKAGVTIIGMGTGTLRPKLVYGTAAAAATTVTAANVTLHNFVVEANFADVTNAFDITAANFTASYIEAQEAGANLNFVDIFHASGTTDNEADGLAILNCRSYAIDAAINSLVNLKADVAGMRVNDNFVVHDHANALAMIQCATGKDLNNLQVLRNMYTSLKTSGDLLIDNDTTANDGVVAYNLVGHLDTAGEVLVDCDGVALFENRATGAVTASGYVLPAIDS